MEECIYSYSFISLKNGVFANRPIQNENEWNSSAPPTISATSQMENCQ